MRLSVHAVQKLDWEWKLMELALCDVKASPSFDNICVSSMRQTHFERTVHINV